MVANAATLITSVIARIDRRGRSWLFLDAGVYNGLFETMAYQGSTRYQVTPTSGQIGTETRLFSLAGPTGDSPDVIAHEVTLPSMIGVGDRLVLHDVGAYSIVCTNRFNGFPHTNVFVI